jgi:H+/Cl- antiporter ClcA
VDEVEPPKLADEADWYVEHTALLYSTLKWAFLGIVAGVCVGFGTRVFLMALQWATALVRQDFPGTFPGYYLLPIALPLCVFLIRTFAPTAKGHGTEAIIAAVHERYGKVDWRVAPIKLIATVLTLAFGGSVGKEGPCAQIGAAITSLFADILKLTNEDRRRLVICGISAGFAAVFGTPVAGALFGIEVLYLGRIEYSVLFPCLVSGIAAHLVCGNVAPSPFVNEATGRLGQPLLAILAIAFGALCGLLALALIEVMRSLEHALERFSARPYSVAFIGGLSLVVIYKFAGTSVSGLGLTAIDSSLHGVVPALAAAFALKIVTTSITLETGGSGGIITPLFYVGATFGAAFGHVFHLPVGLFAAFGFIAVAAAAANTPIAFSVMAMSILPPGAGVYAALAACTAYLLVGHRSVYASQKLGFVKSAGLKIDLGGPVGQVSRHNMGVQSGTTTHRILNMRRRKRAIKRKPAR